MLYKLDHLTAFDRVWHEGLWHTMTTYGISKELIDMISSLYASSGRLVLVNRRYNQIEDIFSTTLSVRKGSLLSPVLFIIFLEKIVQYIIKDYNSIIPIGS